MLPLACWVATHANTLYDVISIIIQDTDYFKISTKLKAIGQNPNSLYNLATSQPNNINRVKTPKKHRHKNTQKTNKTNEKEKQKQSMKSWVNSAVTGWTGRAWPPPVTRRHPARFTGAGPSHPARSEIPPVPSLPSTPPSLPFPFLISHTTSLATHAPWWGLEDWLPPVSSPSLPSPIASPLSKQFHQLTSFCVQIFSFYNTQIRSWTCVQGYPQLGFLSSWWMIREERLMFLRLTVVIWWWLCWVWSLLELQALYIVRFNFACGVL